MEMFSPKLSMLRAPPAAGDTKFDKIALEINMSLISCIKRKWSL